jgi:membrane protein YdbS with pleckstrin-like domain
MFSNAGPALATGLIAYVIFALLGIVILYYVIRTAVINALYRHQLWLEEYRPDQHPGPVRKDPPAPLVP